MIASIVLLGGFHVYFHKNDDKTSPKAQLYDSAWHCLFGGNDVLHDSNGGQH